MDALTLGLLMYLAVILVVGFVSARHSKTHADFLLGGRRLGPWAISLSERASAESAWLIVGLPGTAYAIGMMEIWTVIGCLAGIVVSWFFIAQPLRELAGRYNALTLPDLLSAHFQADHHESHTIRLLSTAIIVFFFVFYVAAQFVAAGKVLHTTFGLDAQTGMLIGGGVIVLYTLLGGFFAVVWTDVVQALIMFTALVVLPIVGYIALLDQGGSLATLPANHLSWVGGAVGIAAFAAVMKGLSWGFGYLGQPHLLVRYMAIRQPEEIRRGRQIALTWAFFAFFGAFFLGLIGAALLGTGTLEDQEFLMPKMAMTLVPLWFAGILISGATAAMMSTADSQLLVATSSLTEDVYVKFLGRTLPQRKLLQLNRLVMAVVAIGAFVLALFSTETVYNIVSYAWSGLGSSFGPVIVLMIYWKKITRQGAIAGLLTGSLATIIWAETPWQEILPERFSSFILALLAVWLVSLLTTSKAQSTQQ